MTTRPALGPRFPVPAAEADPEPPPPVVRSARPAVPRTATDEGRLGGHITELHGLRGLALLLVVLFHLFGAGRVSGGVDVFLFVSGFLATRQIVTRGHRGTFRFGSHYARLLTRLVPTALVVLIAVAVATWLFMPAERWTSVGGEIVASALFYENWELITHQLAYGAAGPAASPLQHFWSLAVQGQFLLLWPLVAVPVVWLTARTRRLWVTTVVLLVGLLPLLVLSFGFAVTLSAETQATAYLHSGARAWEILLGAVVALVAPYLRLPDLLRAMLGWLGLGLVASSGFLLDGAVLFPGPYALWPLLGAAMVLVGSGSTRRWAPVGLLGSRPLRFIADISYELYLWHWPILIFLLLVAGSDTVTWPQAMGILVVSGLLAWLTQRAVAQPLRFHGDGRGALRVIGASVAATAIVAVPITYTVGDLERRQAAEIAALAQPAPSHPGAAVLQRGDAERSFTEPFRPSSAAAHLDLPPSVQSGCRQEPGNGEGHDEVVLCDVHEPDDPRHTVVIAGASHSFQWEPAFGQIAEQQDWHVVTIGKGSCRLALEPGVPDSDCARWQHGAVQRIIAMNPDLVVTVGTITAADGERVSTEQVAAWQELDAAGIRILTIRDNPRFHDFSPPACVEEHGPDSPECALPRQAIFAASNPVVGFQGVPDSARHIDLTDRICDETMCRPVVGNVLVYRDWNHLTGTYVRTLTPMVTTRLRTAVPWLF